MKKFLIIIIFVALFTPFFSVNAANYAFIGVTIDSLKDASGANFCLYNNTVINIIDMDNNDSLARANMISKSVCTGETLWSGLVSLESGHNYGVKLDTLNCPVPYLFNTPHCPVCPSCPSGYGKGSSAYSDCSTCAYGPQDCASTYIVYDNPNLYPTKTYHDWVPANYYAKLTAPYHGAMVDTRETALKQNNGKPICRIMGDSGATCNQVCATAGLSAMGRCDQVDDKCDVMRTLFIGSPYQTEYFDGWSVYNASSCSSQNSWYDRIYALSANSSFRLSGGGAVNLEYMNWCDDYGGSSIYHLCSCNTQTDSYTLQFTPIF